jgi:hypothetical protein
MYAPPANRPYNAKIGDPKNPFPTGRKFKKKVGQNVPVSSAFFAFFLDFQFSHARLERRYLRLQYTNKK